MQTALSDLHRDQLARHGESAGVAKDARQSDSDPRVLVDVDGEAQGLGWLSEIEFEWQAAVSWLWPPCHYPCAVLRILLHPHSHSHSAVSSCSLSLAALCDHGRVCAMHRDHWDGGSRPLTAAIQSNQFKRISRLISFFPSLPPLTNPNRSRWLPSSAAAADPSTKAMNT